MPCRISSARFCYSPCGPPPCFSIRPACRCRISSAGLSSCRFFRGVAWTRDAIDASEGNSLKPDVRLRGKRNRRRACGDFAQAENAHRSLLFAGRRKKTDDLSHFQLAPSARRLSDSFHNWPQSRVPAQHERNRPCPTTKSPSQESPCGRSLQPSGETRTPRTNRSTTSRLNVLTRMKPASCKTPRASTPATCYCWRRCSTEPTRKFTCCGKATVRRAVRRVKALAACRSLGFGRRFLLASLTLFFR
jgi:hypothetical protein